MYCEIFKNLSKDNEDDDVLEYRIIYMDYTHIHDTGFASELVE